MLSTELLYDLQLSLYISLLIKFCLGDECNSSFLWGIWPSTVTNSFFLTLVHYRSHKALFLTVKMTIYLPNENFNTVIHILLLNSNPLLYHKIYRAA